METSCIQHAIRGGNVVALLRVDVVGFEPAWVVYFRIEHGGGARVEQWSRCSTDREPATELYQRGVEDFIEPIPFVPVRVEPEQPARFPSLHQVVHPDGSRSVPMALNAATREAAKLNGGDR